MKKIYTIIFLVCSIQFIYSQSGWFWQNPLPQGNDLNSVTFVNSNNGFAVGSGTILKTSNAGLNWIILQSFPVNFNSVSFADLNTGYAGGLGAYNSGCIYKTVNGGFNWIEVYTNSNGPVKYVQFINQSTGFALLGYDRTILVSTSNSGINWNILLDDTNFTGNTIYFTNADTGFIAGRNPHNFSNSGYVTKTVNRGINWTSQSFITDQFTSLFFINQNTGYLKGYRLYKTTNCGVNWLFCSSNGGNPVFFTSEQTGYSIGNNAVLKTIDGGYNWTSYQYYFQNSCLSMCFPAQDVGYIVGYNGQLGKTTNAGINWFSQDTSVVNYDLYSVAFPDSITGYAAGLWGIIKTTNGGLNWFSQYNSNYYNFFNSLFFININTGYAGCDGGAIFKTTDGGENWYATTTSLGSPWNVFFPNENTGYAAGKYNCVYKTTNAGSNWMDMTINHPYTSYESIYFTNVNTGYAAIENGCVFKTTNGAVTWDTCYYGNVQNQMYSVFFTSPNIGYAGGENTLLKTTNSGSNWIQLTIPNIWIYSIRFYDQNTGYITGGNIILKTTDAGTSWVNQYQPANKYLYSIYPATSTSVYVVGSNGTILKTTTGGVPIGIKPISNRVPDEFFLYQNYPNPFNPTTKIKFDIPLSRGVPEGRGVLTSLTIYDILGREVTTLINENLQPGTYEIEWNAANFASGVYFYQLRAGDFVQTKKLVLLK